ncbi:MAG TPA: hypothetical protein VIZ22_04690 [Candidatus Limnocylindrales bacterium]
MTARARGVAMPEAGLATRIAVVLLCVTGFAISLVIVDIAGTALFLAFAGIGGYLSVRAPGRAKRIGWLLILDGLGLTLATASFPFDATVLVKGGYSVREALYGWTSSSGWALAICAYTALVLIYPSGRLPTGAWSTRSRARSAMTSTSPRSGPPSSTLPTTRCDPWGPPFGSGPRRR